MIAQSLRLALRNGCRILFAILCAAVLAACSNGSGADFNGTVIVEWLNLTPGFDNAPEWCMTHTEMLRSGYAWISVSAQKVGFDALVDGSAGTVLGSASAERYQSLHHPGDSYGYDSYLQLAQAIGAPAAILLLGNLTAKRVIVL